MAEITDFESLSAAKGFKTVHLNIRSIIKKIDQIKTLLFNSTIDILSISETWLKPHLNTKLVNLQGFETYRLDRRAHAQSKKRGGGLLLYVNNKHSSNCESLEDLNVSNENIEAQWILIHRPHCKNVVFCNLYHPPNGDLAKAIKYLDECLKTVNTSKIDVFLMGDMNVNYQNVSSPAYKKLNFFAQSNGLAQSIKTTTRNTDTSKSLIDLALTNSKFIARSGTLNHFISDHQPIYVLHKKKRDSRKSVEFEGRSYRDYNEDTFRTKLLQLQWGGFYELSDPGEAWQIILKNITLVLDEMCPLRTFRIKNYRPDWMTNELIEQIKDRDYFYQKAKKRGDEDSWNIAKFLRNVTNTNIRQARREFILKELKQNENNSKKFWKVIREVIPSDKSSGKKDILLKSNGDYLNREDVAGYINDYFINIGNVGTSSDSIGSNVPKSSTEETLPVGPDDLNSWCLEGFRETEVYRVVKDINVSKSSGLDNISSFIIKQAFKILIPEITHMYNLSVKSSVFPEEWKVALVIPIPKSGDLSKVQNYRPISLLPLPGKILEKLIHSQLSEYLETELLLSPNQHGFRKNHLTLHSIAQLTNSIDTKMDSKIPTFPTFIDFRKAFDCVQHNVLLGKLKQLEIGDSVINWVKSYLSFRKQKVLANGFSSSWQTITQGVPQGSVLGPLFYIIYANDLIKHIKYCKAALYADDTVLYIANKNPQNSISRMQQDVNALSKWCTVNGIRANTDKTKLMVFGSQNTLNTLPPFEISMNSTPLQTVLSYKYLGITLDSHLNYNLYVNKIVSSVSNKLKQFQRMRSFLSMRAAILVYKSMMLPILEYGDILLSATSKVNRKKLQTLQNKALRCALNKGIETSSADLHSEAKLLKLNLRREQHLLNYMYDWSQLPGTVVKRESCKIIIHAKMFSFF